MTDNIEDLETARRRKFEEGLSGSSEVSISHQIMALAPGAKFCDMSPGRWDHARDAYGLPPHCPVRPLGRDGDVCYVLNAFGTVSTLTANNSKKGQLQIIFSPRTNYAVWAWPRVNARKSTKDNVVYDDNFDADATAKALIDACTEKSNREGAWDMVDKVRGRGCWQGDDGRLIIHAGDRVLVQELGGAFEEIEPDEYQGYLYPKRPAIDGPAPEKAPGGGDGPGAEVLNILRSWSWARPNLDPDLLLGWLGVAFLGGALNWRPAIYVTGDKGVGKSTLEDLLGFLLGRSAIKTTDTTAAGIYRRINNDSLPILVDEMESKPDDRKAKAVLELARQAASGGLVLRASQDGGGAEFRARSAFLFASINPPHLEPQDRSRMGILELRPLEDRTATPAWGDEAYLAGLGRQVFKRLADDYERVLRLIQLFRARLIEAGHDGRGGDTFGTLAALSHAALYDDDPEADLLDEWAEKLSPGSLMELETASEGWADCLDQLLNVQPEPFKHAAYKSVGELLAAWRDAKIKTSLDPTESVEAHMRKALAHVGLGLHQLKTGADGIHTASLFVPSVSPLTAKLFEGTKWAGRGVWASSLRQMPRSYWRTQKVLIGLTRKSGIAISLTAILKDNERDDDDGS